jgi:hypothetical protein
MRIALIVLLVIVAALALTNPSEAEFREHVRKESGLAGQFGLVLTDLVTGGIKRQNYLVASKFYIGGDGIVPRQDLAWGIAGRFIAIEREKDGDVPEALLPRR